MVLMSLKNKVRSLKNSADRTYSVNIRHADSLKGQNVDISVRAGLLKRAYSVVPHERYNPQVEPISEELRDKVYNRNLENHVGNLQRTFLEIESEKGTINRNLDAYIDNIKYAVGKIEKLKDKVSLDIDLEKILALAKNYESKLNRKISKRDITFAKLENELNKIGERRFAKPEEMEEYDSLLKKAGQYVYHDPTALVSERREQKLYERALDKRHVVNDDPDNLLKALDDREEDLPYLEIENSELSNNGNNSALEDKLRQNLRSLKELEGRRGLNEEEKAKYGSVVKVTKAIIGELNSKQINDDGGLISEARDIVRSVCYVMRHNPVSSSNYEIAKFSEKRGESETNLNRILPNKEKESEFLTAEEIESPWGYHGDGKKGYVYAYTKNRISRKKGIMEWIGSWFD